MTNRTIAALATIGMAVALIAAPALASDANTDKIQDRLEMQARFTSPALIQATGLDEAQLVAYGTARANRQDRLTSMPADCRTAEWPAIPVRCLFADDGIDRAQRQVRTITVETRVGDNTSVLVRVPATIAVAR